jgi:hypothetical protein
LGAVADARLSVIPVFAGSSSSTFGDVLHDFAYPSPPRPEQEELSLFPS